MVCKNCGWQLSKEAAYCPQCGTRVKRSRGKGLWIVLALLAVALLAGTAWWLISGSHGAAEEPESTEITAAPEENTAPEQAETLLVAPDFQLIIDEGKKEISGNHTVSIKKIATAEGRSITAYGDSATEEYTTDDSGAVQVTLEQGFTYRVEILGAYAPEKGRVFHIIVIDGGASVLKVHSDPEEGTQAAFEAYLAAAKATVAPGSWVEDVTASLSLYKPLSRRRQVMLKALMNVFGYQSEAPEAAKVTGTVCQTAEGETQEWQLTYEAGRAVCAYTAPEGSSREVALDNCCFPFEALTREAVRSGQASGNQISMLLSGQSIPQGLLAITGLMEDVEALTPGDVLVTMTTDEATGKVAALKLTLSGSFRYQGELLPMELTIAYAFRDGSPEEVVPAENERAGQIYAGFLQTVHDNPQDYYDMYRDLEGNVDLRDVEENTFAIGDIDQDGIDELLICFDNTYMSAQFMGIWKAGLEDGSVWQWATLGPFSEFYTNGVARSYASHNQSYGTLWPYTLMRYDESEGAYKSFAGAHSVNQEIGTPSGAYVPEEDVDGDGEIYYFVLDGQEPIPLTLEDYNALVDQYIPETCQIPLEWKKLTPENFRISE